MSASKFLPVTLVFVCGVGITALYYERKVSAFQNSLDNVNIDINETLSMDHAECQQELLTMKIQERYNELLQLDEDGKKKALRALSVEERKGLIEMCNLPSNTSQKALVKYLEEISNFSLAQRK